MPHLGFHPAPGLGELLPGNFVVPQNPIRMAQDGVTYIPSVGELMPGSFVVPQNPLVRALVTPPGAPAGSGNPGMGCGEGCSPMVSINGMRMTTSGYNGMGLGIGDLGAFDASTLTSLPWGWIAGGVAAFYLLGGLTGNKRARSDRSVARAKYKLERAQIRQKYVAGAKANRRRR